MWILPIPKKNISWCLILAWLRIRRKTFSSSGEPSLMNATSKLRDDTKYLFGSSILRLHLHLFVCMIVRKQEENLELKQKNLSTPPRKPEGDTKIVPLKQDGPSMTSSLKRSYSSPNLAQVKKLKLGCQVNTCFSYAYSEQIVRNSDNYVIIMSLPLYS